MRRAEAGVLQLLREVVGLQLLAGAAEERPSPTCELPPVFGTMFITRPAVSDSPRPPDGRERDFLRVADVGDVHRRLIAAGRVADVEPVDRQAAFVVAAAVDGKLRRGRARRRCRSGW